MPLSDDKQVAGSIGEAVENHERVLAPGEDVVFSILGS